MGALQELYTRLFNAVHLDKNIIDKYVAKLIRKFEETGSVSNIRPSRNRSVRNEAAEIAVLGHVALDNT